MNTESGIDLNFDNEQNEIDLWNQMFDTGSAIFGNANQAPATSSITMDDIQQYFDGLTEQTSAPTSASAPVQSAVDESKMFYELKSKDLIPSSVNRTET